MKSGINKIFYASGAIAIIMYILHVVLGGILWNDYNHLHQPISDLTANGAPNKDLMLILTTIYGLFSLLFALTFLIKESKSTGRMLYLGGLFFVFLHIVSLSYNFFPEDLPGSQTTFTGFMHIFVTGLIVPFTICTPVFIGIAYRKNESMKIFSVFSIICGVGIFIFGALSAYFFINKLQYFGVIERINIGILQTWTFVLSIKLLRK